MTRSARAVPSLLLSLCLAPLTVAQECSPAWILSEVQPTARHHHAMTLDPVRGKVLLYGGDPIVTSIPQMLEWDGAVPGAGAWRDRSVGPAPTSGQSSYGAMAFDPVRMRALYYGSWGLTWEWDAVSGAWQQHSPSGDPHPRIWHSMAFDSYRQRILLYGGRMGNVWRGDLWEWDGSSNDWVLQQECPVGPLPEFVMMTYDSRRQRVILFDSLRLKLWENDSATMVWTERFLASGPSPRKEAAFTFDAASGHAFFFGGATGANNTTWFNDLWEWNPDAGTWTERALSNAPPPRYAAQLVADPARHRVIMFGGTSAANTAFADVWEFNPVAVTQWLQRSPASPAPRTLHSLAFDDTRHEAILFSGATISANPATYVPFNETWIRPSEGPLAGSWIAQAPATSPPARILAGMAYNSATRRALLFGGSQGGAQPQPFGDTWEWESDSRQWVQRQPALAPEARYSPALAYDAVRGDILLFGGANQESLFGDTWKWHSATSTWTLIVPALSPPARGSAAMAYDVARDRFILFGGFDGSFGNQGRTDTWEYHPKNESWTELLPDRVPPVGSNLAMVYNPDRATMLLRCGTVSTPETWEWDGATWTALAPATTPTERTFAGLVFDTARRTILHFGGLTPIGARLSHRTWEFTTSNPSPILRQPQPLSIREGDTAAFAVSCPAATPPTYRWRRNGIPLTDDGRISGTLTPILHIKPALLSDAGDYDVLITGPCDTIASEAAALSTTCYANCDLSPSLPALSAADYLCFLDRYAVADPYANCDGSSLAPTLNVNDFICFMNKFAAGCP